MIPSQLSRLEIEKILVDRIPTIDVRSPSEFDKGSLPGAVNLPLLNDTEREHIGKFYKNNNLEETVRLGNKIISGQLKIDRIDNWIRFISVYPNSYIYCARGGMRSKIVQEWLYNYTGGNIYPCIVGGYKAIRSFFIEKLSHSIPLNHKLLVIGGMTGTGKTSLLSKLDNSLDLEAFANHRGSSFGKNVTKQPSISNFENYIAVDYIRKNAFKELDRIIIEDEGPTIGKCRLPGTLYKCMQEAPLVWLEDTLENRIQRIVNEYVIVPYRNLEKLYPGNFWDYFCNYLLEGIDKIKKRLGFERHKEIRSIISKALALQISSNSLDMHRIWINMIIKAYYDPMYQFQRKRKDYRIIYRGNSLDVLDFLKEHKKN